MIKKILIAGGTGLIGQTLSRELKSLGYKVALLSRRPTREGEIPTFQWDISKKYIDPKALQDVDLVINLAGAGVVDKRWSDKRKKVIIDSRVSGNEFITSLVESGKLKLKKFISASAIGYYGDRGNEILTENSAPGTGFLPETCKLWEESAIAIKNLGIPTSIFRIGLVLAKDGGVYPKLVMTAGLGLGTYFGSGDQIYSWIHLKDLVDMIIWTIKNEEIDGIFNATSPQPLSNKMIMEKILENKGGLKILAPVPSFLLKMAMGEMSVALLGSSDVRPEAALQKGFKFSYDNIEEALKDLAA